MSATDNTPVEISEITFKTEEEALEARKKALVLYNAGAYEDALDLQVDVLAFVTEKYGEKSPAIGIYYLDYGLTLLAVLQGTDRAGEGDAALKGIDEEEAENCFQALELARVCYEKAEDENDEDLEIKFRLAEVHDAIAQLELEKDNSDGAMAEFEHTLLLLRNITPTEEMRKKHSQAIASALFNCARCFMHEEDYAGAATSLAECIAYIGTLPEGTVSADLVDEVNAFYADAVDNRDNKTYLKVKESIHELFPDEKNEVSVDDVAKANPYLSAMPAGEGGNTCSLMMANLIPIPGRESSNSTSRSVFPMQGTGERSRSTFSSSNGPVNVAVVRKKEKKASNSDGAAAATEGEPATKKNRPEESASAAP